MLSCHGSDGAAVRKILMEEDIQEGSYGLACPSFTKKGKVKDDGNVVLADQDAIHGGKKAPKPTPELRKSVLWGALGHQNHSVLVR